jgi:hypothetical protein
MLVYRGLTVQDDELVDAQDLLRYGRPVGNFVVTANLQDLDQLILADASSVTGVGLACRVFREGYWPNCFHAKRRAIFIGSKHHGRSNS